MSLSLNFDFEIFNPDGEPLKEEYKSGSSTLERHVTAWRVLSGILFRKPKGIDEIKAYEWSLKLTATKSLSVDNTDAKALREAISAEEHIFAGIKAQLNKVIDRAEIEDKAKKEKQEAKELKKTKAA